MTDAEFQAELDKREADKKSTSQTVDNSQQLDKAKREVVAAVIATTKANMQHRENTTTKVDVQNPMADSNDINRAVEAINNVAVLMLSQGQQKPSVNMIDGTDLGDRFNELGKTLTDLLTEVRNDTKQDDNMQVVTKQLDMFLKQLKSLQVAPDPDIKKSLANVEKAISSLDMKPTVNVPAPKVTVQGTEVDLSPLVGLLKKISVTLDTIPKEPDDDSALIAGLSSVQSAITSLRFPVPNYVLPYTAVDGESTQAPVPLVDKPYDYVGMSNADGNRNYQTFVYKQGGSGGVTVRTLTYTYDESSNVTSITRS